jgi:hypothetical protein
MARHAVCVGCRPRRSSMRCPKHSVIPGRRVAASPESIVTGLSAQIQAQEYRFRAPSLRSGPGMTCCGSADAPSPMRTTSSMRATANRSSMRGNDMYGRRTGDPASAVIYEKKRHQWRKTSSMQSVLHASLNEITGPEARRSLVLWSPGRRAEALRPTRGDACPYSIRPAAWASMV